MEKRRELGDDAAPRDRHTSLKTVLKAWLDERNPEDETERRVRRSSWRTDEQHVRLHIDPYLGNVAIGRLTVDDVESWLQDLKRDMRGQEMRRKVLKTLRAAMTWAVRRGYLNDPMHSTVADRAFLPIKPDKPAWVPLPDDDLDKILRAISKHRNQTLFRLAVTVGIRQGELLGLRRGVDLDFKNHMLTVNHTLTWHSGIRGVAILEPTKTAAGKRTIALPDSLWDDLIAHLARMDARAERAGWKPQADVLFGPDSKTGETIPIHDLVFLNRFGRPARGDGTGGIGSQWHHLLKVAGVDSRRFHDSRHMAASMLLRLNGNNLVEVAHILGHSTYRHTVDLYSHLSPNATRALLERVVDHQTPQAGQDVS